MKSTTHTSWTWNVPQLTRQQLRTQSAITQFFGSDTTRDAVLAAIRRGLAGHIGPDALLAAEGAHNTTYGVIAERTAAASVGVVLTLAPALDEALLVLDHAAAAYLVDRVLGGNGARAADPSPLTDAEHGVLQFVVLGLLQAVHTACGGSAPYHFRFAKILRDPNAIESWRPMTDDVVCHTWRVGAPDRISMARLILPAKALESRAAARPVRDLQSLAPELARFASERVTAWVEAGMCTLHADELADLAVGDVVLLEQSLVAITNGAPTGRVIVRIGAGQAGGVRCRLRAHAHVQCEVEGME